MLVSVTYSSVYHYFVICAKTFSHECLLGERVRVNSNHSCKTVSLK